MKLRAKTLLIVTTTLASLLAVIGILSLTVLLRGFARVEYDATDRDISRFEGAVAESISNLGIKAADWAKWDDTYEFIIDRNEEYVESNLADESLFELELTLMLFIDNSGNLVFGRAIDAEGEGVPVAESALEVIRANQKIMRHPDESSEVEGIVMLPDGPVTLTSRPILTSTGEGPVHGTIIFARSFDEAEVSRLGELTHLSVVVHPLEDPDMPEDMASRRERLAAEAHVIEPLDPSRIAGYTILRDTGDRGVLLARIEIPRDVYRQGLRTVGALLIFILVAGAVLGLVMMILLGRTVITRVSRLDRDVEGIAVSGDRSRRVEPTGKDELAALGTSINTMLAALERSEADVRSRNAEMRLLMDTVPAGLLSLNETDRINPEYSRSAARILGRDKLDGAEIYDVLGMSGEREPERAHLRSFLDLLRKQLLPPADAAGLNPCSEYLFGTDDKGTERWLRLAFYLIDREGAEGKHILVVLEDISEEKAMKARAAETERENMQLKVIAEDPELFREFLAETARMVGHAREKLDALGSAGDAPELVNEMFRDVHTVKGTAASFGVSSVSEIAGNMEESLSPLRESGAVSPGILEATRESLDRLEGEVAKVVERTRAILGEDAAEGGAVQLRISLDRIKSAAATVDALLQKRLTPGAAATSFRESIRSHLLALRAVPARRGLARSLRIVPGLLGRVGKSIKFTIEGEETPIDYEMARELNTPLVHLLRNSFDHGIEPPDERRAGGKTEAGEVRLRIERSGRNLVVSISDDGRGLDPRRLARVAVERGMLSQSEAARLGPAEAQALIFRPGFSTAEGISEVSGRGVGLDAVKASVEGALRGTVSVVTEIGKSTTFTLTVPAIAE